VITLSDEVCQIKMGNGNPCVRQTYKDKKKCIFHLENKSDEEAKIFEIAFWKELMRMEKDKGVEKLDFTGFIFTNEINFNEHLFEKTVYFSRAQFNSEADFSGAQFKKVGDFSGVQFNNKAYFSNAKFNNEANFFRAQFKNNASFSRAQFNREANFLDAQFNDKVNFLGAQFKEVGDFSGAQFKEFANFRSAQFNSEADFENSEFQSVVSFINAKFPSSGEDLISFKNVKFHKPKDVRFQKIDLSNVSFLNTDITEVDFLDEKWARKNGRLAVMDETRIEKGSATYGAVAQLYRRLRRNYESNYRFAEAGDFFIGEMEMRRHDVNTYIKNEKIKNIVLWIKRKFSLLGIYKYPSLYGESYFRPAIIAFIVIFSYPLLMHWLFNPPSITQPDDFLYTDIRTSAASFFQMDNTYIIERIIGIPILGLLFIALKRKFERKR
jgi:hypothetical protein